MKMWRAQGFDAMVLPTAVTAATVNGKSADISGIQTVAYFANYFDLPAGVVPIRLVKKSETTHARR